MVPPRFWGASGGRRYLDPANSVARNSPTDQAGGLDVLDEGGEPRGGRLAGLRRADGLLHGADLAFEDARAGHGLLVDEKPGLQARERLELLVAEALEGFRDAGDAHELRLLQRAREIEVVRAFFGCRDAPAFLGDVGDAADRRAGRNEEGDRELEVGRAEGDLVRALRLGADEGDVPLVLAHRFGGLSRRVEAHVLDRQAGAARELAREVRRDALRRAVGRVLEDEQEVL